MPLGFTYEGGCLTERCSWILSARDNDLGAPDVRASVPRGCES